MAKYWGSHTGRDEKDEQGGVNSQQVFGNSETVDSSSTSSIFDYQNFESPLQESLKEVLKTKEQIQNEKEIEKQEKFNKIVDFCLNQMKFELTLCAENGIYSLRGDSKVIECAAPMTDSKEYFSCDVTFPALQQMRGPRHRTAVYVHEGKKEELQRLFQEIRSRAQQEGIEVYELISLHKGLSGVGKPKAYDCYALPVTIDEYTSEFDWWLGVKCRVVLSASTPKVQNVSEPDNTSYAGSTEKTGDDDTPKADPEAELRLADSMGGHDFEYWCAALLKANGFKRVEVTKGSGDQGVDILATKDEIRYAIQCKCYHADLGNKPVQEINAGRQMYKCHVAAVMTNRGFTQGAQELANATGVLLWGRNKLLEMIKRSMEG